VLSVYSVSVYPCLDGSTLKVTVYHKDQISGKRDRDASFSEKATQKNTGENGSISGYYIMRACGFGDKKSWK